MAIDHAALLTKYIAFLHLVEGADFVDDGVPELDFTDEEMLALKECAATGKAVAHILRDFTVHGESDGELDPAAYGRALADLRAAIHTA